MSERLLHALALSCLAGVTGCERPPPVTAASESEQHHYGNATARALGPTVSEMERRKVTLEAAHALDPTLSVDVLSAEELSQWVGIKLARRLDPSWVILRLRTNAAPIDLDQVTFSFTWKAADGVVPVLPPDAEHLADLTDEHFPRGHSTTRIAGGNIPWPVTILTVGVLDLLTLHTVTDTTPATDEEIRKAVPIALRFEDQARGRCGAHGSCNVFLVTRRPADEASDLRLGVSVWAGAPRAGGVAVRAEIPIVPGAGLDGRLRETFREPIHLAALAQAQMSLGKLGLEECSADSEVDSSKRCRATALVPWPAKELRPIGIALPPRPAELGTMSTSRAKRPWWARWDKSYAPHGSSVTDATPADAVPMGVPVTLSCELSLDGYTEDTDSLRLLMTTGKERDELWGSHFTLPLLRLSPKEPIGLEIYDTDTFSGDDWLAGMKLAPKGAELRGQYAASKAHPDRGPHAEVVCKTFTRDAIEPLVLARYVKTIDALESAGPPVAVLGDSELGVDKTKLGSLRASAEDVAGLVGWDDPRTQTLVEKADAYEAAFLAASDAALAKAPVASLPLVVSAKSGAAIEIRRASLRCDAKVTRTARTEPDLEGRVDTSCAIDMEIANAATEELWPCELDGCRVAHISVELEGGRIASLVDSTFPAPTLGPGQTHKGTAYLLTQVGRGRRPVRLIVRSDAGTQVVPL